MASTFTHVFAGSVIGHLGHQPHKARRFLLFAGLAGTAPDIDFLLYLLGFPHDHMFGHRGITHSLSFCLLIGFLFTIWYLRGTIASVGKRCLLFLVFSTASLSHLLLDAITDGDSGVAILAPFSNHRYQVAHPFLVEAPLADEFFHTGVFQALISEFVIVWIPVLSFYMIRSTAPALRRQLSLRWIKSGLDRIEDPAESTA